MARYNGHRSWNAWNVSLWISNDEALYRQAVALIQSERSSKQRNPIASAARQLIRCVPSCTPDGAKYNITCIREALTGLEV